MGLKVAKEVKVGVVVVAAIAFFIWGYTFLKGKDLFEKTYTYYAVYSRVDGLAISAPVLVNGIKVGTVSDIHFLNDTNNNIVVELKIDKSFLIHDSTIAEIFSADLMGSRAIHLIQGRSKKYYRPNDTLLSSIEADLKTQVSAQVLPLKKKAEDLIKSIDSVMTVVQSIFDKQTRYNLSRSFESIRATVESLERTSISLDTLVQSEKYALTRIIANIESITENFRNNNELITNVMKNLSAFSDSLQQANVKQTIINANKALQDATVILEKINRGEGSLGMLIHNEQLYTNLENSSKNLDLLLRDLRENPKRYVHFSLFDFGRTVILEDNDKNRKKLKKESNENKGDTTFSYRIQIKSSKVPIPLNSKEFKGMDNVNETYAEGWYKYTIGSFNSKQEAEQTRLAIIEKFPGAFIVGFKGNKIFLNRLNSNMVNDSSQLEK
ncbi:MAG: MCE family protein [Bacteroidales bacterium]|nr:MCE family protein [Bacteroidales bacterium]